MYTIAMMTVCSGFCEVNYANTFMYYSFYKERIEQLKKAREKVNY